MISQMGMVAWGYVEVMLSLQGVRQACVEIMLSLQGAWGCVGVMLPLQGVWCEGCVEAMLSLQGYGLGWLGANSERDTYEARC